MTVGKLIELLQELPKEDLIEVKCYDRGSINFKHITGVLDNTDVGVWDIIAWESDENNNVWTDAKARGEI